MSKLVDAQIHIWQASRPDRPWPQNRQGHVHGPPSVTIEEINTRMDAAGVASAILIPPSFEGDRNDLVLDAVRRYPERFRALARLPLDHPAAPAMLGKLAQSWELMGTRIAFAGPMRSWLTDGTLDWFWPKASDLGVRVSLYPFGQLGALEPILKSYPALKVSLDHLGLGLGDKDAAVEPIIDAVVSLARYPNLAVKATCLPYHVTEVYPYPALQGVVRRIVDAYGPQRVFWGSDLTRLSCSYAELVSLFTEALSGYPASDVDLVMGAAAKDWYGWRAAPGQQ